MGKRVSAFPDRAIRAARAVLAGEIGESAAAKHFGKRASLTRTGVRNAILHLVDSGVLDQRPKGTRPAANERTVATAKALIVHLQAQVAALQETVAKNTGGTTAAAAAAAPPSSSSSTTNTAGAVSSTKAGKTGKTGKGAGAKATRGLHIGGYCNYEVEALRWVRDKVYAISKRRRLRHGEMVLIQKAYAAHKGVSVQSIIFPPSKTVRNQVKTLIRGGTVKEGGGRRPWIGEEAEEAIITASLGAAEGNSAKGTPGLCTVAKQMIDANPHIGTAFENGQPGEAWAKRAIARAVERNPDVRFGAHTGSTEDTRAKWLTRPNVLRWYRSTFQLITDHGIARAHQRSTPEKPAVVLVKPQFYLSLDETDVPMDVEGEKGKVLYLKSVGTSRLTTKGASDKVSLVVATALNGESGAVAIILKGATQVRLEVLDTHDENGDDASCSWFMGRFIPLIILQTESGGMDDAVFPQYLKLLIETMYGRHDRVYGPTSHIEAMDDKAKAEAMKPRRLPGETVVVSADGHGSRLTVECINMLESLNADISLGIPNGSAKTNAGDQHTFELLKGGRGSRTGGLWGKAKRAYQAENPDGLISKSNFLRILLPAVHKSTKKSANETCFQRMGVNYGTRTWWSTMLDDDDIKRNTVMAERERAAEQARFTENEDDDEEEEEGGRAGNAGGRAVLDVAPLVKLSKEYYMTHRVRLTSGALYKITEKEGTFSLLLPAIKDIIRKQKEMRDEAADTAATKKVTDKAAAEKQVEEAEEMFKEYVAGTKKSLTAPECRLVVKASQFVLLVTKTTKTTRGVLLPIIDTEAAKWRSAVRGGTGAGGTAAGGGVTAVTATGGNAPAGGNRGRGTAGGTAGGGRDSGDEGRGGEGERGSGNTGGRRNGDHGRQGGHAHGGQGGRLSHKGKGKGVYVACANNAWLAGGDGKGRPTPDNPIHWVARVKEVLRGGRRQLTWYKEGRGGVYRLVDDNEHWEEDAAILNVISTPRGQSKKTGLKLSAILYDQLHLLSHVAPPSPKGSDAGGRRAAADSPGRGGGGGSGGEVGARSSGDGATFQGRATAEQNTGDDENSGGGAKEPCLGDIVVDDDGTWKIDSISRGKVNWKLLDKSDDDEDNSEEEDNGDMDVKAPPPNQQASDRGFPLIHEVGSLNKRKENSDTDAEDARKRRRTRKTRSSATHQQHQAGGVGGVRADLT